MHFMQGQNFCLPLLTGAEMTDSTSETGFLEPPGGGGAGAATATAFSVPVDPNSIVARLQHTHGGEGAQVHAAGSCDIADAGSSSAGAGAGAVCGVGSLAQHIDQDLEVGAPGEEESVRAKESPLHSRPLEDEDDDEEEHLTPEQLGMPHLFVYMYTRVFLHVFYTDHILYTVLNAN